MFNFNKYTNDDFGIEMNVKMNQFFEEDAYFSENREFYHNLLRDYHPLHEDGVELGQASEEHDQYHSEELGGDEDTSAKNDEMPEEEPVVEPEEMENPEEYVPDTEDESDSEPEEEDAYSPSEEN